ncbi:MAG TPA: hypothetical protein VMF11_12580 [Candidatus Baltobacteraceae bacterium]|nr:hypothetical protein [Candidatus Baltobacteraceae bacterium]
MFIASLLLAAGLSPAPPQTAYTGIEPVRVASCALDAADPSIAYPFGPAVPAGVSSTAISFVNTDQRPIASVVFTVSDGRTTSRIVDKGTFSSGVEIDHSFATPEFGDDLGSVQCSVASVAFADGSIWQAQ